MTTAVLMYRIGDAVELGDTDPPIVAIMISVRPSRGPAYLRIAYLGPDGTEVRH